MFVEAPVLGKLSHFPGIYVHIYKEKKPHASRNLNVKNFP